MGYLAGGLNILGLILLRYKISVGWLFGIVAEILWIIRAGSKDMPDLILISFAYICIAVSNWWKWKS